VQPEKPILLVTLLLSGYHQLPVKHLIVIRVLLDFNGAFKLCILYIFTGHWRDPWLALTRRLVPPEPGWEPPV